MIRLATRSPTLEFFCSHPMETSPQLSDVLALGKRLVAELDADESRDTLSHWMAHHIAGLMHNLDEDHVQGGEEREEACRRAILELWAHRSSFRRGARPFGNAVGHLKNVTG